MKKLTLEQIVKEVGELPALPQVTQEVLKMTEDPNSTVLQISKVISYDQVLAAKVLKLANSAYYGFARKISCIQDAVVVLGLKTIKHIVLAASVHGVLNKECKGYHMAKGELWKHSLVCGMTSRYVANKTKFHNPDEAFVAGLLHDIGKVVLGTHVCKGFQKIIDKVENEKISFKDAETEILGFNHAEVGAKVAGKWNLPHELVEAIEFHHNPLEAPNVPSLVSVVHIADAIITMMGIGLGADGMLYSVDEKTLEYMKLKAEDVEEIISNMCDMLVDLALISDI